MAQLISIFGSSLVRRVSLAVFAAVIFIEIVILIPSYLRQEERFLIQALTLAEEVVILAFNADPNGIPIAETVPRSAKTILSTPHVAGYRMKLDGVILTEGGVPPALFDVFDLEKPTRLSAPAEESEFLYFPEGYRGLGVDIALRIDLAFLSSYMRDYVLRIAGLVLIIAAFVTAVTIAVLWALVLRPVIGLHQSIAGARENWLAANIPDPGEARQTEIGSLIRAFGAMLAEVQDAMKRYDDLARFPTENPNPILRCDGYGRALFANESARSCPFLFWHRDQTMLSEELRAIVLRAIDEGDQMDQVISDGKSVLTINVMPVLARGYVSIYGRNITEQRAAENRLEDTLARLERMVKERTEELSHSNFKLERKIQHVAGSEERFRAYAASTADFYWETDTELRCTYLSDSYEEVTGVPRDVVMGVRREDLQAPDVDPATWEAHLEDMRNQRPFRNLVYARLQDDGSKSYYSLNGVPVFDEDGVYQGYRGTGVDVTVLHAAKLELHNAKDMAEEMARARSDFLASMSQEIQAPMKGIVGMTELLLESDLPDEQKSVASTIMRSSASILDALNDVLDISMIESGHVALEQKSFSLGTVIESVSKSFAEVASDRQLAFATRISKDTPNCFIGDENRLRQILVHLVENAIKFTEEGSVVLEVKSVSTAKDRASLQFSVADTGVGVSLPGGEAAFGGSTDSSNKISDQLASVGIGLRISSKLVELMGGEIGVESSVGKGSRFHFTIPLLIDQGSNDSTDGVLDEAV